MKKPFDKQVDTNTLKSYAVGHPAAKRHSFQALVTMLYKLGVTHYMALPVMSNPYHLVDMRDVEAVWRTKQYK